MIRRYNVRARNQFDAIRKVKRLRDAKVGKKIRYVEQPIIKMVLNKRKNEYDEFEIKCYTSLGLDEDKSYFTNDWSDAVDTFNSIADQYSLNIKKSNNGFVAGKYKFDSIKKDSLYSEVNDDISRAMQKAWSERDDYTIEDISSLESYLYDEDEDFDDEEFLEKLEDTLYNLSFNQTKWDAFLQSLKQSGISYKDGLRDLISDISQFADDLLTDWGGRG